MNTSFFFIKWLVLLGYWLLIINIVLQIIIKRRSIISSILAWLLIMYLLPFIGIITWLLFGEPYLGKKRIEIKNKIQLQTNIWINQLKLYQYIFETKKSDTANSLFQLCKYQQGISAIKGVQLQLFSCSINTVKTLIHDINLARKNIEMIFYIWKPGGIIDELAMALIKSSKRGICCKLILDSAGSLEFFKSPWVKIMRSSGIQIVEALKVSFFKIFFRRIDLRQHRKIILIDNYITYTGSMNLADPRFFKKKSGVGPWIDLMIRLIGPVASMLSIIYSCDWEMETGKKNIPLFPSLKTIYLKRLYKKHSAIQVIPSGPDFKTNIIHQVLLISIYSAKERLIITTPYLVPSDEIINALCTAAQRGVEVNIIVPKYNDSILVQWASRAFFSELLDAGVKIYEFEKGLLHSKTILVDNQLSLIGTFNLDMRSLWLNFEITLAIDDANFSKKLSLIHDQYKKNSKLLDPNKWQLRAYWKRIIEKFFYFLSPLL